MFAGKPGSSGQKRFVGSFSRKVAIQVLSELIRSSHATEYCWLSSAAILSRGIESIFRFVVSMPIQLFQY